MSKSCIVDGIYNDSKYLDLCIFGKYVFEYTLDEILKSQESDNIFYLTNSKKLRYLINKKDKEIHLASSIDEISIKNDYLVVSSSAVLLKSKTIKQIAKSSTNLVSGKNVLEIAGEKNIISRSQHLVKTPVFKFVKQDSNKSEEYVLTNTESLTIETKEDFELAIVMINMPNKKKILEEDIKKEIKDKNSVFTKRINNAICFIGHSQLDHWNISKLNNKTVRNCAISGISNHQYEELIIDNNLLKLDDPYYVYIAGTNDIVYEYTDKEICDSINRIISKLNIKSKILFIECLRTNGRLDRDNKRIKSLNNYLKKSIDDRVIFIECPELYNEYGELNIAYSKDGLHLNEIGYSILKEILENKLKEIE